MTEHGPAPATYMLAKEENHVDPRRPTYICLRTVPGSGFGRRSPPTRGSSSRSSWCSCAPAAPTPRSDATMRTPSGTTEPIEPSGRTHFVRRIRRESQVWHDVLHLGSHAQRLRPPEDRLDLLLAAAVVEGVEHGGAVVCGEWICGGVHRRGWWVGGAWWGSRLGGKSCFWQRLVTFLRSFSSTNGRTAFQYIFGRTQCTSFDARTSRRIKKLPNHTS